MRRQARKGEGRYDAVVIGAGTAGLVTAAGTAGLGGRVALVERREMGGDCLNYGCVPSKALIAAARVAHAVRRAPEFGIEAGEPRIDFARVFAGMRERRARIAPSDSQQRFEGLGVDVFRGDARLLSRREVAVGDVVLRGAHVVIASGTHAFVPPVPGLSAVPYLTNETFFDELHDRPESLMILGGGPIGCELAQVLARLGVRVVLVEMLDRLLPRDDADASGVVAAALAREGVEVRVGTQAAGFARQGTAIEALLRTKGGEETVLVDKLLVAVGRAANVDSLDLGKAGVAFTPKGITVDAHLETTAPGIFACGDVAGPFAFTHTADYQARIVVRNILAPWPFWAKADYRTVPWVTYTDPEVAQVGTTEAEAAKQRIPVDVHRLSFEDLDRAVLEREEHGFVKVVCARGKDAILGATVVGPHAGEVIHELVLAMKTGVGLSTLSGTIHAYPTFSAAVQRVGDIYARTRLTPFARKVTSRVYRIRRG